MGSSVPAAAAGQILARRGGSLPGRTPLKNRSGREYLAREAVRSRWWSAAHRDLLDLLFHAGVMTVEQLTRLFYVGRNDPARAARDDARRMYRVHLLDYTADVSSVLDDLTLPRLHGTSQSQAVCLGRAGEWLVAGQHGLDPERLSRRAWSVLRPLYLAHNLMLAELLARVLPHVDGTEFAGEFAAGLVESKKVSTGKGTTRQVPRPVLRPDGLFRFPSGRVYLVEVERARRYDFQRILDKVQRYERARQTRRDLWQRRWGVETFPPVLMLMLDPERHLARLRDEARDNRVGFLFRAWADLLQSDDPLDGWRSWRDGARVTLGQERAQ